jgi:hypothetical protein
MFPSRRHRWSAYVLLGLVVGCATARPDLKTPMPEQFSPPPDDDPRYSKPFEYPKELLNRPPVKSSGAGGMPGKGIGPQVGGGGMGQN